MNLLSLFQRSPNQTNGRKPYEHRPTFVPKWKQLPDSIVSEYSTGATIFDLAVRHKSNPSAIHKKLTASGVQMRRPGQGYNRTQPPQQKISDEQMRWLLQKDLEGMSHSDIAKEVGVSRERIRQVCAAAGNPKRRPRQIQVAIDRAQAIRTVRKQREEYQKELVRRLSELYMAGGSFEELAQLAGCKTTSRNRGATKIAYYRKKYPNLFPPRIKNHWTGQTPEERAERLLKLSEAWKSDEPLWKLAIRLGYKNKESLYTSLRNAKYQYPELFPGRKKFGRTPRVRDGAELARASAAWIAGKHHHEIAREMGYGNPRSFYNQLRVWRKNSPDLFPKRKRGRKAA